MIFRTFLFASCLLFGLQAQAQPKWSLAKCIQYAQQNNLTVMQTELGVRDAVLTNKAAKQSRYPNLQGSVGAGVQFGLREDPSTGILSSQSLAYNSFGLNSQVVLYNGNRIKNTIKQSAIDIKAAEADLNQTTQNIALDVAVAFLNILLTEDQLENANKRLELSFTQLDQTDKLINAGSRPAADLQDIQAQVAQDEQIVVNAENNVTFAYLRLTQLLQLDPDKPFKIDRPDIEIPEDEEALDFVMKKIYERALSTQPGVLASELKVESAEVGVDIAGADKLPSVVLFGDLSSNYSSKALDLSTLPPGESILQDPAPGEIDGVPANIALYQYEFTEDFANKKYFNQVADNFGQSVGVNLSIPIYSRGLNNTRIQQSELALKRQQIQEELVKQQLKQDIQTAIADATAGYKNYVAAKKTEAALATAYSNTEKKFKLGASNTLEYTTAKNQLDRARVDTIIAKYDYIFKLKVVEFYEGKKIEL